MCFIRFLLTQGLPLGEIQRKGKSSVNYIKKCIVPLQLVSNMQAIQNNQPDPFKAPPVHRK